MLRHGLWLCELLEMNLWCWFCWLECKKTAVESSVPVPDFFVEFFWLLWCCLLLVLKIFKFRSSTPFICHVSHVGSLKVVAGFSQLLASQLACFHIPGIFGYSVYTLIDDLLGKFTLFLHKSMDFQLRPLPWYIKALYSPLVPYRRHQYNCFTEVTSWPSFRWSWVLRISIIGH